ncbi:MAG: hypothetical protein AB1Z23_06175 [Eubacteriales bacterium]
MAIELCPRCNLNYVKPGMKYCKICMNDFKDIEEDDGEVCPMCGENILEDGEDLCADCLEKRIEMSGYTIEDENVSEEESSDEDMDGMRLVDLEEDDDTPEEVKEEFNT